MEFIHDLIQFQFGSTDCEHIGAMKVSVGLFNYLNNYERVEQLDDNILKYEHVLGIYYFYKTQL